MKTKISETAAKLLSLTEAPIMVEEGSSDIFFASADYKDAAGLAEEVQKAMNNLGIFCYEDPNMEGSDIIGLIFSKRSLSEEELQAASDEAHGV